MEGGERGVGKARRSPSALATLRISDAGAPAEVTKQGRNRNRARNGVLVILILKRTVQMYKAHVKSL